MNRVFQVSFHVPGTLTADLNIRFTAPFDMTLKHISAVGSNTYAGGLNVGLSSDTNGYLELYSIGVSDTPVEKEAITDFAGALAGSQFPRILDGEIVVLELDYDYAGGGSANDCADVTIVMTFLEG
ncbi:hypothetical protein LCGC14_0705660 [marine sediment metagenome]|uniref:Spore coat protein U domain-containing protein n=1 Tax=marine sediment metagenome TaxID=412755 RepID=A0A0F9QGI7_9ZZZZ|nr:hypothetical protein [bacterium]